MKGKAFAVDQSLGALDIMGSRGMPKCFHLKAILFIPLAGTDVQLAQAALLISGPSRQSLMQALSQQIGKEMMVAVPAPLVVQGYQEEVCALQILEGFLSGRRRIQQNCLTQRTA